MGVGYTIDTPLKVAKLGIDSVVCIGDDILLERLRKMYSGKFDIPYQEISKKVDDFRAKRITSYLNMLNASVSKAFDDFKKSGLQKKEEIKKYFDSLPDSSSIKREFNHLSEKYFNLEEIKKWIKSNLTAGSIDVNIMAKADREYYDGNEKLGAEFNHAHSAVRGYARSNLRSSLVLSAGLNPRLYAYMEEFDDFYPDESGEIKKKIVLKVSDYRSALIQGKFLAKKGLWVSEFRIESGLNCGGHAFATEGLLMGPILAQFRDKRDELVETLHEVFTGAMKSKGKPLPNEPLNLEITAQGGVGTAEEHNFLLSHYKLDSIGWGSPFLLVPEVTNVDDETLDKLIAAKEEDLYLSNVSPLGIPFNNLKGNSKDQELLDRIMRNKPGSPCPKKYLALNTEFTDKPICTSSRQYQYLKLKELEKKEISKKQYQIEYDEIVSKSCICIGLGTSALLVNGLDTKTEGKGVSVCPGPNLAYFSKKLKLNEMIDHIYGRSNVISRTDRPHMFLKELDLYVDYLRNKISRFTETTDKKEIRRHVDFAINLQEGIHYYRELFLNNKELQEMRGVISEFSYLENILKANEKNLNDILLGKSVRSELDGE